MPLIASDQQYMDALLATPRPNESGVLAFYEDRLGMISTNPRLLLMPTDDHLAHRGDGIFEAVRYQDGAFWALDEHLQRMERSAAAIGLIPPCSWQELRKILSAVALAGKRPTGILRVIMGRGAGGFGVSPAECPKSSLYVIAGAFTPYSEDWYQKGLAGFKSSIPAKQGYLARIKSTNYLPNVLMMQEALAKGFDVPFCFSAEGFLTESAVANLCLVSQRDELIIPLTGSVLPGTTMHKAASLVGDVVRCVSVPVADADIFAAKEVLCFGTTPVCASVVSYEGKPIGTGKPGPIAAILRQRLTEYAVQHATPLQGLV